MGDMIVSLEDSTGDRLTQNSHFKMKQTHGFLLRDSGNQFLRIKERVSYNGA